MKMTDSERLAGLLLQIPCGRVTTYKAIANALGTRAYRYVGQLLHRNPDPEKVPCFKVVGSDGKLTGFALGLGEKARRLSAEGISVKEGKVLNLEQIIYTNFKQK